jgi:hypothetical protein
MQTSSRSRSTTSAARAYRGPAYYLGRRADVWLALRHHDGHPAGEARRIPNFDRRGAGAGRS